MKPSLDGTFERWRAANPKPSSGLLVPVGYKRCRNSSCPVLIEAQQERALCYGCGGRPSVRVVDDVGTTAGWVAHQQRMRKLGVRPGRPRKRPA